jgi:hypothetical protein
MDDHRGAAAAPLSERCANCLLATSGKTAQVALYGLLLGAAFSLVADGGGGGGPRAATAAATATAATAAAAAAAARPPLRAALAAAALEGGKTAAILVAGVGLGCLACAAATRGDAAAVTELSLRTAPAPALWAAAWGGTLAHLQMEAAGARRAGAAAAAAAAEGGGGGAAVEAAVGAWARRVMAGPLWGRAAVAGGVATAVTAARSQLV